MCGRFSLFAPRNDVEERFGATFADDYRPRYNAAPSQSLPILPDADPETFRNAEWGLVPTWADDRDDGGHINARAETVASKPSFEDAVRGAGANAAGEDQLDWEAADAGRCLVPADGFYEWGDTGDGRRPHRIEVGDRNLFAMAGLWTRFTPNQRQAGLGEFAGEPGEAEAIETFTILTTEANDVVAPVHDRMPVILAGERAEAAWLEADIDDATALLAPYDGEMKLYPVSDEVNSPANDSPAVVEPVDG